MSVLDDLVKISSINSEKLKKDVLDSVSKLEVLREFEKIRRSNKNLSQSQICSQMGTSVSTLERVRKDIGCPSPYRYSTSSKTDAQKEKEKYKRIVYSTLKSGVINEGQKTELYSKINSGLTRDVKDEVMNLKTSTNRRTTSVPLTNGSSSSGTSGTSGISKAGTRKETRRKAQANQPFDGVDVSDMRGGTLLTEESDTTAETGANTANTPATPATAIGLWPTTEVTTEYARELMRNA